MGGGALIYCVDTGTMLTHIKYKLYKNLSQLVFILFFILGLGVPYDALLGRYRLTLDLFGRVFVDSVGLEPGSIISELGGFPVKEAKFRKEMEKLRNSRTSDLTLNKIERERSQLIITAFKEFNNHYQNHTKRSMSHPPMVVNRVKVSQFS